MFKFVFFVVLLFCVTDSSLNVNASFSSGSNGSGRRVSNGSPFRRMFSNREDLNVEENDPVDPGAPLMLTPLLDVGDVKAARKLSAVRIGHRYGHSFAGFITVNKKYNSNLYFWFFPSTVKHDEAPVVVWLQGGPGGSSLFGLFTENGPFFVNDDMLLEKRKYSWTKNCSVLYIDNPVGTGFSFSDNDAGFAENEVDVGRDLYEFMRQFYVLFPELVKNPLYITGESYAGKYVPAFAFTIHQMNQNSLHKLNLQGIAIGDGLCDPVSMTNYGDFLYQIGLVDESQREVFLNESKKAVEFIKNKKWIDAFQVFDNLLNGDLNGRGSIFTNMTGLKNYYNFLLDKEPESLTNYEKFVNLGKIRLEMKTGNLTFHNGIKVEQHLLSDVMQSVKPWIEELLKHYKVMIYNGQLDIIIASTLTDNFIATLDWPYAKDFAAAPRHIWRVDGQVAGYVKQVPNFAQVLVRNAGHMVPMDQPKWAFDMIMRFINE